MFTMKFHNIAQDHWEVYHANHYSVEVEHDEMTGHESRTVLFTCGDKDHEILIQDVDLDESFHACYIVNDVGNTVDRVTIRTRSNRADA